MYVGGVLQAILVYGLFWLHIPGIEKKSCSPHLMQIMTLTESLVKWQLGDENM